MGGKKQLEESMGQGWPAGSTGVRGQRPGGGRR